MQVVNFTAVDDIGRVINPMIVEGQVQGGVAQGIGQALLENAVYDEQGQLLTGSFMDYTMPRARRPPARSASPPRARCAPTTRSGSKGVGEVGAIGSPPAVINAVVDALRDYGVRHIDMPATPRRRSGHHPSQPAAHGGGIRESIAMYDFNYTSPATIAEAVKALGRRPGGQGRSPAARPSCRC